MAALLLAACAGPTSEAGAPDTTPVGADSTTAAEQPAWYLVSDDNETVEMVGVGTTVADPPPHDPTWAVAVPAFEVGPDAVPERIERLFLRPAPPPDTRPLLLVAHRWDPGVSAWIPLLTGWNDVDGLVTVSLPRIEPAAEESVIMGLFEVPLGTTGIPMPWTDDGYNRAEQGLRDELARHRRRLDDAPGPGTDGAEGGGPDDGPGRIDASQLIDCTDDQGRQLEVAAWRPAPGGWSAPPVIACRAPVGSTSTSVTIANNRPYGMLVDVPNGAQVRLASHDRLIPHVLDRVGDALGPEQAYLFPGSHLTLVLDGDGPETIEARVVPSLTGLDAAAVTLNTVFTLDAGAFESLLGCLAFGDPVAGSAPDRPLPVAAEMIACARTEPDHRLQRLSPLFDLTAAHLAEAATAVEALAEPAAVDGPQPLQIVLGEL